MPQHDVFRFEPCSRLERRNQKVHQQIQQLPLRGRLPNQRVPGSPHEVCDKNSRAVAHLHATSARWTELSKAACRNHTVSRSPSLPLVQSNW